MPQCAALDCATSARFVEDACGARAFCSPVCQAAHYDAEPLVSAELGPAPGADELRPLVALAARVAATPLCTLVAELGAREFADASRDWRTAVAYVFERANLDIAPGDEPHDPNGRPLHAYFADAVAGLEARAVRAGAGADLRPLLVDAGKRVSRALSALVRARSEGARSVRLVRDVGALVRAPASGDLRVASVVRARTRLFALLLAGAPVPGGAVSCARSERENVEAFLQTL